MGKYFVYIMNSPSGTLYTGITNDIRRRVYEHKYKLVAGYTARYNVTRLACFEETDNVYSAITREKEIKGWRREKKQYWLNPRIRNGKIFLKIGFLSENSLYVTAFMCINLAW